MKKKVREQTTGHGQRHGAGQHNEQGKRNMDVTRAACDLDQGRALAIKAYDGQERAMNARGIGTYDTHASRALTLGV